MKLNDQSIMPFGKYKGKKMENVPASYLHWLYTQQFCDKKIEGYVEDNMEALMKEYSNGIWKR